VTFPPFGLRGSVFDGAPHGRALIRLRGLADHFERKIPRMHKTNTVDYAVVHDGENLAGVDDGERCICSAANMVVQNGTRHASNKGTKPVTMLFS